MKNSVHSLKFRTATALLLGAALAACGGSTSEPPATLSASIDGTRSLAATSSSTYIPQSRATAATSTSTTSTATSSITDVRFESTAAAAQSNVPVTFGQVFAPGHLASAASLSGRLDNGVTIPLQLDVKAKHPDGSVRHAIISAVLPSLAAGEVRTMTLNRDAATASTTATTAALMNSGFTASVNATIAGVRYSASADELIKKALATAWLNGSTASEWQVSAPLTTSAGVAHPHLTARFSVRWYDAVKKARVDVVIENNWAYEAAPQNVTYDADILVGGKSVYAKPALQHFHHARWRKMFWWNGAAPEINIKHNSGYLIDSRALPNYNRTLSIPESVLNNLKSKWTGAAIEPMGSGLAIPYMPTTGGRDDIGMLPQWAVVHLLSMDRRARDVTLGTAEQAGSYSAHYRDKKTGQPVSLIDYPYMTLVGTPGDTMNPATKQYESFPKCATTTACTTPYTHDVSHQPAFAYMPYMLTGDHFFLEELQFWGMYNVFNSNPGYRENIKGLLKPEQVRGQAWALRTLAEAAYITPDNDRLKEHFNRILDSNLDWYNQNYPNNPNANKLGIIVNGYAVVYSSNRGMAPWMDDFFTAAIGHAHDLGFTKATTMLKWKAQFPIQRMMGEGTCYIRGAMYSMMVRDSQTSPYYTTIGQAFKASDAAEMPAGFSTMQCGSAAMATALKLKVGEMTGYSAAYAGYPSNMQPALAYAADVGGADGAKAWSVFMARTVKPDYRFGPQFDIVPR
ncbi:hypothetical protein [Telluria aromaticivorans]|uniref:hypothetical protein n=1 Tax=Telluria aromaticivorans TaxID=2725995 RepID=UPI001E28822B|nr:hypothetical protein [Telluria aromaticivorans]